MNIDLGTVVKTIASITAPQFVNLAHRNECVIKILKELKIDPAHPPKNFHGIYAYTLVEYGVDQPKPILKILREREIQRYFWRCFCLDDIDTFIYQVVHFIDSSSIGDEVIKELGLEAKKDIKSDINSYLQDFYQVFINITKLTMMPADVMRDKNVRDILFRLNQFSNQNESDNYWKQEIGNIPSISPYPEEFKTLIKDKTELFCGRKFVFDAIQEFIDNNPKGYFTIVGDPGIGKSAIAAKYVLDNPGIICFFNIRAEGKNSPELFLRQIREQLINRYQLNNAIDKDLSSLLTNVSEKISDEENLVIVIDALDEVDQESPGNLLYLPTILPNKIYFILTRRPYNQEEKRLFTSPTVPTQDLDLREAFLKDENKEDVKQFIQKFVNNKKYNDKFKLWLANQVNVSIDNFIEKLILKSENNFMYLRYLLLSIVSGYYSNKSINQLPKNLIDYYIDHWRIMGMTKRPLPRNKIKIIYIICVLREATSCELIAEISKLDISKVEEVIKDWIQFLHKQEYNPPRYRFYHESFRDFLQRQDTVKRAKVDLSEIKLEITNNIMEGYDYE